MTFRKQNNENKPLSLTPEQITNTVSFLNRSFRIAADEFKSRFGSSNVRGTTLYDYQVEFAYIIDKIQRGPVFFAIQHTAEANELIGRMSKHQKP